MFHPNLRTKHRDSCPPPETAKRARQDASAQPPRAKQVPALDLSLLADAALSVSSQPSPIGVTVDGIACATERSLHAALTTYHAHQARKDVAAQLAAVRARAGGVCLVVGGQRGPADYRSPRGLYAADDYARAASARAARPAAAQDFTLNTDAAALPHLWGDVASSATMMRFPSRSVDAVHFEYVPYEAFTSLGDTTLADMFERHRREARGDSVPWLWSASSPTEYRSVRRGSDAFAHLARVMRPGASLEVVSGFPPHTARASMMQALAHAGFEVTRLEAPETPRTLRSCLAAYGWPGAQGVRTDAGMRLQAVLVNGPPPRDWETVS